jgi:hypothetical protein
MSRRITCVKGLNYAPLSVSAGYAGGKVKTRVSVKCSCRSTTGLPRWRCGGNSVLRLRRLKIATNGKAAGIIANRESLKTMVAEYEKKLRPAGFWPVGPIMFT